MAENIELGILMTIQAVCLVVLIILIYRFIKNL